ncbi:MAG: aminoacyl-tRNA hydrolase [Clostridia bacterium]|nr:aminoacyl-tRNA hydrolase [Clostridia bacterium]
MFFKRNNHSFNWLVVGLGNPGTQYENTRHNVGFKAIDEFAERNNGSFNKHKFDAVIGECTLQGNRIMIAKPQTFMNNSGRAVTAICSFYKIPYDRVILMFDDISLEVGKIRIRRKGSAGGHNGIKDIIQLSGTEDIPRIKIGVGAKPHPDYDLKDWVLGKFPNEQREEIEKAISLAAKSAEEIITRGIDSAMNRYSK